MVTYTRAQFLADVKAFNLPADGKFTVDDIKARYRYRIARAHPDHGGSTEKAQEVNATHARLRAWLRNGRPSWPEEGPSQEDIAREDERREREEAQAREAAREAARARREAEARAEAERQARAEAQAREEAAKARAREAAKRNLRTLGLGLILLVFVGGFVSSERFAGHVAPAPPRPVAAAQPRPVVQVPKADEPVTFYEYKDWSGRPVLTFEYDHISDGFTPNLDALLGGRFADLDVDVIHPLDGDLSGAAVEYERYTNPGPQAYRMEDSQYAAYQRDIQSLVNEKAAVLTCQYFIWGLFNQRSVLYKFWYKTRPPEADLDHARSIYEFNPLLFIGSPLDRCPVNRWMADYKWSVYRG